MKIRCTKIHYLTEEGRFLCSLNYHNRKEEYRLHSNNRKEVDCFKCLKLLRFMEELKEI